VSETNPNKWGKEFEDLCQESLEAQGYEVEREVTDKKWGSPKANKGKCDLHVYEDGVLIATLECKHKHNNTFDFKTYVKPHQIKYLKEKYFEGIISAYIICIKYTGRKTKPDEKHYLFLSYKQYANMIANKQSGLGLKNMIFATRIEEKDGLLDFRSVLKERLDERV